MIGNAAVKYYPQFKILPSMTIAQAIKESNWGKSGLSRDCFNYYGMKWTSSCGCDYKAYQTKEWDGTKYITVTAKFRKYKNAEEGIKGYYQFITGYKRYKNLQGVTDSRTSCMLIQQDGWATSPTYGTSLYNDYVVKYGLTTYDAMALGKTQSEQVATQPIEAYPTLKKGDTNEYVLAWQKFLNLKGYKLAEDGIFGNKTLAAVKDWQAKNGLVADGIIGIKTWKTVR